MDLELAFSDRVVLGWRAWRFRWVEELDDFSLSSICLSVPYPAGVAAEAVCSGPRAPEGHLAPHDDCRCGIYGVPADSLRVIDEYVPWPPHVPGKRQQPRWLCRDRVVGTVALWGEVIECQEGWKGQYAYPQEVLVPASARSGGWVDGNIVSLDASEMASRIEALYNVKGDLTVSVMPDDELKRLLGLA